MRRVYIIDAKEHSYFFVPKFKEFLRDMDQTFEWTRDRSFIDFGFVYIDCAIFDSYFKDLRNDAKRDGWELTKNDLEKEQVYKDFFKEIYKIMPQESFLDCNNYFIKYYG